MPVDERRLRGRYAPALVALAGPASNLLLAALGILAVGLWDRFDVRTADTMPGYLATLRYLLWTFGYANVMLALFNLLPVPPLDGARIASNFSSGYAQLIDRLTSSGAVLVPLILVFLFVSRPLVQFAGDIAVRGVQLVRGY
jgi:Zn-dependent protease